MFLNYHVEQSVSGGYNYIRITISYKDFLTTGKGAKYRLEGSKWVPMLNL